MGAGQNFERINGYLHIETTRRNFQAGEAVQGVIHLHLDNPVQAQVLILKFKGVEMGMWNHEGTGYEALMERENMHDHYIGRGHTISQRFPIYSFNTSYIGPGQFSFPFTFLLPTDISGSFHLEYGQIVARITYSLIALLDGPYTDVRKYSLHIHINQLMTNPIYSMADAAIARIKTGCFSDKGYVQLRVSFTKNAFAPGESVELIVEANNENCGCAIIGFNAKLFRTVKITAMTGNWCIEKDALRQTTSMQRVPPASSLLGDQSIRMKITIDDYRHDILHAVSVHSRYVDCAYSVCVTALMESSSCGGQVPEIERHVQIYPRQLPLLQPKFMPQMWQPQVMPMVQFNAGSAFHYEPSSPLDHRERINIV